MEPIDCGDVAIGLSIAIYHEMDNGSGLDSRRVPVIDHTKPGEGVREKRPAEPLPIAPNQFHNDQINARHSNKINVISARRFKWWHLVTQNLSSPTGS